MRTDRDFSARNSTTSELKTSAWAINPATSERILDGLVQTGFLLRARDGAYVRTSAV